MDVKLLENDEIQVELEIRGILPSADALEVLSNKIEDEKRYPIFIPDNIHKLAIRNCGHELKLCTLKLNRIESALNSVVIHTHHSHSKSS